MTSVGIDIIEIDRIESAARQWGKRFLDRVYTDAEIEICRHRVSSLAARFAAKEAVMKALGTGAKSISWREIEVLADGDGKPLVRLYGRAKNRAEELNLHEFSISLSDTKQVAIAVAVAT